MQLPLQRERLACSWPMRLPTQSRGPMLNGMYAPGVPARSVAVPCTALASSPPGSLVPACIV